MIRRMFLAPWDWDLTWMGTSHLRPAANQPLPMRTVMILSHVWSLPLLVIPAVYVYLAHYLPPPEWKRPVLDGFVVLATLCGYFANLSGNLISAFYWNERAAELRDAEPAGG